MFGPNEGLLLNYFIMIFDPFTNLSQINIGD
jgi:hypothetical protein